jgi:hypothetical protein
MKVLDLVGQVLRRRRGRPIGEVVAEARRISEAQAKTISHNDRLGGHPDYLAAGPLTP